ncbi:UNVERIFIED_CONTAM: hypothetical protein NCL1_46086 [Trichonephila clavipes]
MGLIFRGSIVLSVWLGSTRTRTPSASHTRILPMQILTSSFHHSTETVPGLIKSLAFILGTTLKRRYFNISHQLILSLRDFMKFLISSFSCDNTIDTVVAELQIRSNVVGKCSLESETSSYYIPHSVVVRTDKVRRSTRIRLQIVEIQRPTITMFTIKRTFHTIGILTNFHVHEYILVFDHGVAPSIAEPRCIVSVPPPSNG